ncbi:MAG: hypothetical protein QXW83_00555 [Nitrososphaerales archaeon]
MSDIIDKDGEYYHKCGCKIMIISTMVSYDDKHVVFFACPKCERLYAYRDGITSECGILSEALMSYFVEKKLEGEDRVRLRTRYKARCKICKRSVGIGEVVFWRRGEGVICSECFWR